MLSAFHIDHYTSGILSCRFVIPLCVFRL